MINEKEEQKIFNLFNNRYKGTANEEIFNKVEYVKLYVAYGSNMDLNQMVFRCPNSRYYGTGVIEDYRLMYKSRYATIEPEKDYKVPVVIFEISKADETMLDRYEGYPTFYEKKMIKVKMEDKIVEAMVYIMKNGNYFALPEPTYYINMEESYKIFGFDMEILEESLIYSFKKVKQPSNTFLVNSSYIIEEDEEEFENYRACVSYKDDTFVEKQFSEYNDAKRFILSFVGTETYDSGCIAEGKTGKVIEAYDINGNIRNRDDETIVDEEKYIVEIDFGTHTAVECFDEIEDAKSFVKSQIKEPGYTEAYITDNTVGEVVIYYDSEGGELFLNGKM